MGPLQSTAPKPSYAPGSMTLQAPRVSLEEAAAIVGREYGHAGSAQRLIGERDENFALLTAAGERFMLKLIHPAEDPAVTNFQTEMLLHVERADPGLPVQRVLRTLDGRSEKAIRLRDGTTRMMRLVSFLPGRVQRGLPPCAKRAEDIGRICGRLQRALEDFRHPADSHEITWDISLADRQRSVIPELQDAQQRAVLEAGIRRFEAVKPALAAMRHQVVHNDLSYDNIVVDADRPDRVAGVLDFGDATRTAVINDVAVAASCNLTDEADPLDGAVPVVAGCHAERALLREEAMVLHDLIIARLVVRVGITEWRAVRFPENRDYILRTTPLSWRLLDVLLRQSPMEATNKLLNACGMERPQ